MIPGEVSAFSDFLVALSTGTEVSTPVLTQGLHSKYFRLYKPYYSAQLLNSAVTAQKQTDKVGTTCSNTTLFAKIGGRLDLPHGL